MTTTNFKTPDTIFQATFDATGDRNPNVKGTKRLFTVRRRMDGIQLLIEGEPIGDDGLLTISNSVVPETVWEAQKHLLLGRPFEKVYVNTTGVA
jgi:hypothetical protein